MTCLRSRWAPSSQRAQHAPSPRLRGEDWDEGRELVETSAYAAAPHPNPLPVALRFTGRGDRAARALRSRAFVDVETERAA